MLPDGKQANVSTGLHPLSSILQKCYFLERSHGKAPYHARSGHISPAATKHICTSPHLHFPSASTLPQEHAFSWVCINSTRVLLGHLLPLHQD